MINLLKTIIRVAWVAALVLGVLLWRGILTQAFNVHMFLGGIIAAALAILAAWALFARVRIPLAVVSILWTAAIVYVGLMQATGAEIGSTRWIGETIHLLLGIGAIGLAEALAGALTRRA